MVGRASDVSVLARSLNLEKNVKQERERVAALRKGLGADLSRFLSKADDLLKDVTGLFLDPGILGEPRSDTSFHRWLQNAEMVLGLAIAHRQMIEAIAAKLGPDAKLLP